MVEDDLEATEIYFEYTQEMRFSESEKSYECDIIVLFDAKNLTTQGFKIYCKGRMI